MTDVQSVITEFSTSARTGRRNALPDIQNSSESSGSSELPKKLENLSLSQDASKKDEEKLLDNNNTENNPEMKNGSS
ncbi:cAMP-dependent protein kinase inhibitor beta [Macrotis lagotis]|uniref:cAMP-dependent protein kinase inhibitor beta n=1 Tax=Macrotis lagotis TaxID=92651 RepID=UPI003D6816F0